MREQVKNYYGQALQGSADLKTNACCDAEQMPHWLKPLLSRLHPEVSSRYYGCGLTAPLALQGCQVLDLGCGSGRDCYVLAQLVGPSGSVLGVDMTEEQLGVAERHHPWHAEVFGYDNVTFRLGYIEELEALDLAGASFDVIVSNCVVNLSPRKAKILGDVCRLLKPGGEFYFSDIYADRRVPASLGNDPILYSECLGGALYWNDFLNLAKAAGFTDPRLVDDRPIAMTDPAIADKVGAIRFYSATYRLFKLQGLESHCEDYGQAVIYQGGIPHSEQLFRLDKHHLMEKGRLFPVCGNTYRMLKESRFAPHFQFFGNTDTHFGIFDGCGTAMPFSTGSNSGQSSAVGGNCC
ncbi:MAG: methyltransferase domain-containing protein [Gammaproteobacteria bacterium]